MEKTAGQINTTPLTRLHARSLAVRLTRSWLMRLLQESRHLAANTPTQSLTSLSSQAPSPPPFCLNLSFAFIFTPLAPHSFFSLTWWRIKCTKVCALQPKLIIYLKGPAACSPSTSLFTSLFGPGQLIDDIMKSWVIGIEVEPVWVETHCAGRAPQAPLRVTTWFLYI